MNCPAVEWRRLPALLAPVALPPSLVYLGTHDATLSAAAVTAELALGLAVVAAALARRRVNNPLAS